MTTRRSVLLSAIGTLAASALGTAWAPPLDRVDAEDSGPPDDEFGRLPTSFIKAKRILIEYRVLVSYPGWTAGRLIQGRIIETKTVEAWLVGGSREYVVLASEIRVDESTGETEFMDVTAIPFGALVRVAEK